MTPATGAPGAAIPCDEALLDRVLGCYKPNARYLRTMALTESGGVLHGRAELGIEESCYIDDTGHLNAVEVTIGYNQMLYYALAVAVREQLNPVFSGWSMEAYWRRRLPDILITRMTSDFHRPVTPGRYRGEFELTGATRRRLRPADPVLIAADTGFRFQDDRGGQAAGRVSVAIIET